MVRSHAGPAAAAVPWVWASDYLVEYVGHESCVLYMMITGGWLDDVAVPTYARLDSLAASARAYPCVVRHLEMGSGADVSARTCDVCGES